MLISTKLDIPPLLIKEVFRKHLIDRLSGGKNKKLFIISGLAGSGKTSLVRQWINHDNLQSAWYSLDESDNEVDLFLNYLLKSLCNTDPFFNTKLSEYLHSHYRSTPEQLLPVFIDLVTSLENDVYLILDDYHFIDNDVINHVLLTLLNHSNNKFHIVLISRQSIPFPTSKFKIRNQLIEIDSVDMQLTNDESEEYITNIIPETLTSEQIDELYTRTAGWLGGLQLFSLAIKSSWDTFDFNRALQNVSKDAAEYIWDEVIKKLPEHIQRFIHFTALLDRFNGELAREIFGESQSVDILEYLFRNNYLLIALNDERTWFRYHHLISDAVRENIRTHQQDLIMTIHRKAALWYASNDFLEDAFKSAFSSGDLEFTADLMEDYLYASHERHEYASGLRWLSRLPQELFARRSILRLHDCGLKMETFQLAEIESLLNHYENNPDDLFKGYTGPKKELCSEMFIYYHCTLNNYYRDPANANLEKINEVSDYFVDKNRLNAGYLKNLVIFYHLLNANPLMAEVALKEAAEFIFPSKSEWARVMWFRLAATIELLKGQLNRSTDILQRAYEFLEQRELKDGPLVDLLHIPMAWRSYHQGDLGEAVRFAQRAVRFGDKCGFVRDTIEGNLILSLAYAGKHDKTRAMECGQAMLSVANRLDSPVASIETDPWSTWLAMIRGDVGYCQKKLENWTFSDTAPFSTGAFWKSVCLIDLRVGENKLSEAEGLLSRLQAKCEERGLRAMMLDLDMRQAVLDFKLNRIKKAIAVMDKVLRFSEVEGFVQIYINYAKSILPLLSIMRDRDCEITLHSHFKAVINACSRQTEVETHSFSSENVMKSVLTPREIEIVIQMSKGLKNKQIAENSFVSIETVKTHIKNIYKKLEVNSRVEAIRKYHEKIGENV